MFLNSKVATNCEFGETFGYKDVLEGRNIIEQTGYEVYEDYKVQKVEYIIDGVKGYGCSCVSNMSEYDKIGKVKTQFGSHY